MARNAHDGLEGSLVVNALERMAESLTQSLRQSLTQSLEGVREAAHHEALNSERRLQETLSRVEERFQETLRESEERAVARSAEQCRQSICNQKGNRALRRENKELKGRMRKLEDSLKTAVNRVFPRVETLVQQLEKRSPPASSTSPSSALPSAAGPSTEPPSSSSNRTLPSRSSSSMQTSAPSHTGGRALIQAAQRGQLEVVRKVLDEGANANFSNEIGWTPLHAAAQRAHADVVSLLVERGADVNAVTCFDYSALHFAALHDITGHCVNILIAAGADLNPQNWSGSTPMHFAAAFRLVEAACVLLAAGASKTIRDYDGCMPYQLVYSSFLRDILRP